MRAKRSLQEDVEASCKLAVESLVKNLNHFWPGFSRKQDNFMSERNLSLQLAKAFEVRGYHSYAEVSYISPTGPTNKVDLLLLGPEIAGAVDIVVVEVKRMHRSDEYEKLKTDKEKIESFCEEFKGRVEADRARRTKNSKYLLDFPYAIGAMRGLVANLSWEYAKEGELDKSSTDWNKAKMQEFLGKRGRPLAVPLTGFGELDHYTTVNSHALFYHFEIESVAAKKSAA